MLKRIGSNMEEITLSNEIDFNFVGHFLNQASSFSPYKADPETFSYKISNPIITRLINNIKSLSPTILPLEEPEYDKWVVIAPTKQQLDRVLSKMNRFIGLSYGAYPNNRPFPALCKFEIETATGYSNEYYYWLSPKEYRAAIFKILEMWLDLEENRPDLSLLVPPNFRDVFRDFQTALATHNWDNAEKYLGILSQNRLTAPENISYLSIELFAQKQQYDKIWGNDSFRILAKGYLPRRIHVAFIKAFHHQMLLVNEKNGDIDQNLTIVQDTQTQYDKLLTYRQDIIDDIAIRVFAYISVVNQTPEAFEKLESITTLSDETYQLLDELKPLFTPPSEQNPEDRFKDLFQNQDFTNAYAAANNITDDEIRIPAQMQCVAMLKDSSLAKMVIMDFENLKESQKNQINNREPLFPIYLNVVNTIANAQTEIYSNWLDWFDAVLNDPNYDRLSRSLDYLDENTDIEFWEQKNIVALRDYLGVITFDKNQAPPNDIKILTSAYFERAMEILLTQLVKDDRFPRESKVFGEVYSSLYSYMLHSSNKTGTNAEILLRLADDKITRNPQNNVVTIQELIEWIHPPRPSSKELWLDIVELGIYHGTGKEYLFNTFQTWIQIILDAPISFERPYLEVLLSLSEWFGDYAESWGEKVDEKLSESTFEKTDPILLLPDGFRIIIYTLDEPSAQRVRDVINKRNSNIDIVLCHEKTMTKQVENLTKNSDMHVLVTTCMKHSLFYGISEYIKTPVYPKSRGSSSILRAIEERTVAINLK